MIQEGKGGALGTSGLGFGVGMLVLGLVLGWMFGRSDGPNIPLDAPQQASSEGAASSSGARQETKERAARAAAKPRVVNNTGGQLRKLSTEEQQQLIAGGGSNAPLPDSPSPFATEQILARFGDATTDRRNYQRAVLFLDRGNGRDASPLLADLLTRSEGQAWREQALVLLAAAKMATGETKDGRALLRTWRQEFPRSPHQAVAVVAEGKGLMQEAKRGGGQGIGELSERQLRGYREALASFKRAAKKWPSDPAVAEALFYRSALLGEMGQPAASEEAALAMANRFPEAVLAPRALFNVGRLAVEREDHERAKQLFGELIERFPRDRMTSQARTRLSTLELLGQPAPPFVVEQWVLGDEEVLRRIKGEVTFVVFWATWCPHCRKAMPGIQALHERYRDRGLHVIAVTRNGRGQTTDKVRDYVAENGLTMPVFIDQGGQTSRGFGVSGIPAAALIGKDGKIVLRDHPSKITDEKIERLLGS